MVRASTRSKTAASVNAAKSKAVASPRKKAVAASNAAKAATTKAKSQSKTAKPVTKPTRTLTRGRKVEQEVEHDTSSGKENVDVNDDDADVEAEHDAGDQTEVEPNQEEDDEAMPSTAEKETADEDFNKETWCVCKGIDDGSPMIKCEECDNWYHFRCISLTEPEAEDIKKFICQSCSDATEKKTEMIWEDKTAPPDAQVEPQVAEDKPDDTMDDQDDEESGDDYVDDDRLAKINKRKSSTRVQAASPTSTDSEETQEDVRHRRRRPSSRLLESGTSASYLKRRKSLQSAEPAPSSKKVKAEKPDPPAEDDPVRKYCLGKLREVIAPIFVQYRNAHPSEHAEESQVKDDEPDGEVKTDFTEGATQAEEKTEMTEKTEVTEEEAKAKAGAFVDELEKCIFEIYSEYDKKGKKIAAAKYKERFRMLTFNLEKEDRVILRENVARGVVSASDLAQMSSTDLANEQTKQEIESARLESLKHSILEVRKAPRAKITHKGEEMIEDVDGEMRITDDIENDLRRRELPMQESSVDTEEPRPHHSPEATGATDSGEDLATLNNELEAPMSPLVHAESPAGGFDISEVLGDMGLPEETPVLSGSSTKPQPQITIPSRTATLSPTRSPLRSASFSAGATSNPLLASALLSASKSTPTSATFDLNAVWGTQSDAKNNGDAAHTESGDDQGAHTSSEDAGPVGGEMGENEFDMFFDKGDLFEPADEAEYAEADMDIDDDDDGDALLPSVSDEEEAKYQSLPVVWNGEVAMPVEADSAWTCPVTARQIGGHSFSQESLIWSRLFTSHTTRIDGRVPVDSSTNYLVTTRLNPSKELIAVGLTPAQGSDDTDFNSLMDFLIAKGRHALVFPWASVPGDRAIGKDLYLIPLKPGQPTPEYIDLLDDVRLPKTRTKNMLLGVFVLHKSRLHAALQPVAPPPIVPVHAPIAPVIPPPPIVQPPIPGLASTSGIPPVDVAQPITSSGTLNLSAEQRNLLQSLVASGGMSILGTAQSPIHGSTPPHPGPMPPPAPSYPSYQSPYSSHSPPHSGYYPPPPPPPAPYGGSQSPYHQHSHHGMHPSRPLPMESRSPPRDYRGPPPGEYNRRRRPSDDYDYGPPRRGGGPPGRGRYDGRDRRDHYDRPPRDSGWSGRGGRRGGR